MPILATENPAVERWPSAAGAVLPEWRMPSWPVTIWRGLCCKCPHCAQAPIFDGYLKVRPICEICGAPLGDMPADDAPPYIAMVAVLHILAVVLVIIFTLHYVPGIAGAVILLSLLAGLCCLALRLAKGAVIGILLKLGLKRAPLHG